MHELKEFIIGIFMPVINWCASLGELGLCIVAFLEGSIFLSPPELILTPMIFKNLANPYWLAFLTSIFNVLGGLFGYTLGRFGGRPLAVKLLGHKAGSAIDKAENFFGRYGAIAIIVAAFTPIPYKIFAISSGICRMNLKSFILCSIIGRSARYFLYTFLLVNFGELMIEHIFSLALFVVVAYLVYEIYRQITKKKLRAD